MTTDLMPLRVLAVSAPHHMDRKSYGEGELKAMSPVSLHNALLSAVYHTDNSDSYWAQSNLPAGDTSHARQARRDKTMLIPTLEDMGAFEQKLKEEKPNLLLIGAMTLSYPGAIECAKRAKEILGNEVVTVLGGRHVTESIYTQPKIAGNIETQDPVFHQNSSPVKHMATQQIDQNFDLVVSGAGESIIKQLGEIVGELQAEEGTVQNFKAHINALSQAKGDWIASFITPEGQVENIVSEFRQGLNTKQKSNMHQINTTELPSAIKSFGIPDYGFYDVFGSNAVTAHVFSRSGMGCIKSCNFCGESQRIVGAPIDMKDAPKRIHQELKDAARVIHEDHPNRKATAFCEDSIFLFGIPRLIEEFCDLTKQDPINIDFGLQMTLETLKDNEHNLQALRQAGASYIFFGLETIDETIAQGMSKYKGRRENSWKERAEEAFMLAHTYGFKVGTSVMFGLGEEPKDRVEIFRFLRQISEKTGGQTLCTVSQNIATLHPNRTPTLGETFLKWGTEGLTDEEKQTLKLFSESAFNYQIGNLNQDEMIAIGDLRQQYLGF